MFALNSAITVVEFIVGAAVLSVVGDYVGYKIGRRKLAMIVACVVLVTIVAFTIYAAVVLPAFRT